MPNTTVREHYYEELIMIIHWTRLFNEKYIIYNILMDSSKARLFNERTYKCKKTNAYLFKLQRLIAGKATDSVVVTSVLVVTLNS